MAGSLQSILICWNSTWQNWLKLPIVLTKPLKAMFSQTYSVILMEAVPQVNSYVVVVQAFGMMGWRVGYLAFPEDSGVGLELLKAQDTIPICAPQLSQQVALGALEAGRPWVQQQLGSVINNRCCLAHPLPSSPQTSTPHLTLGITRRAVRASGMFEGALSPSNGAFSHL